MTQLGVVFCSPKFPSAKGGEMSLFIKVWGDWQSQGRVKPFGRRIGQRL